MSSEIALLAVICTLIALLYASVGQAGASGYLAAMGLFGMAPAAMKTIALSLNLLIAGIGTLQFWRGSLLSWRTSYGFAVLGFPFSRIGGAVQLPTHLYYPVMGVISRSDVPFSSKEKRHASFTARPASVLFVLGYRRGHRVHMGNDRNRRRYLPCSGNLVDELVSLRRTAAVTAAYNLLHSAAALTGAYSILGSVPQALPIWLVAVGIGGAIGAFVGSRHLPDSAP